MRRRSLLPVLMALVLALLACITPAVSPPAEVAPSEDSLEAGPVSIAGDEPTVITGDIRYTSPFFLQGNAEPFVLLEDETGFITRDLEFSFPLASQTIGPVELVEEGLLRYTLPLPSRPQGTPADLDNDGEDDPGVMVFAIAYWSNTWGDPFLERRDGRGWSNAYTSARTDPYREDEIDGGTLLIWAPDDEQGFPTDFGPDGLLFTADDPTASVPAGYNLVDLDQQPFRVYKEAAPELELLEGVVAVTDLSALEYSEAFEALFEKASREYPFTDDKAVDWDALHAEYAPRFTTADFDTYYRALKEFTLAIPDGHVGLSFDAQIFYDDLGGSYGMVLAELSDGTVVVTQVLPGTEADLAGIRPGAILVSWNGQPVSDAVDAIVPFLGPHSTAHAARAMQLLFLTRGPIGSEAAVEYTYPGETATQVAEMVAAEDYDSLFAALPEFNYDPLLLPVEGMVLPESGLGYLGITTFSEDYNLMARLWQHHMEQLLEAGIAGLIVDVRNNGGGSGGLALDFAGYFFDEEVELSQHEYYNEETGAFEARGVPSRIEPAPLLFEGPVAVLVGPNCVSACEGFVHAMSQGGRAIIVGHAPTAGAYGEVGRGQYDLPGDLSVQFPTGRPETPDGELLIEGTGIEPDLLVPVTYESAMGEVDAVLEAAIQALLDRLGR